MDNNIQDILRKLRKLDKHPELSKSLVKEMEEMNAFYYIKKEYNLILKKESNLPLADREHIVFIVKNLKRDMDAVNREVKVKKTTKKIKT